MTESVILDCRHVWKIFGAGALLAKGKVPDADALARAGVIGAVRDVNVQIRQGAFFVIMGLSGSGKSTLVRCLSRLDDQHRAILVGRQRWININFFDTLEAIKTALLKAVLLPVNSFFSGIPWAWGMLVTGVIAWRLGL